MHLSDYFGKTINEIKRYSQRIIPLNKIQYKDTISNRLSVISNTIESLSRIFRKKTDYLFLLGDRAEVLEQRLQVCIIIFLSFTIWRRRNSRWN